MNQKVHTPWWKNTVVYQVYPRSFMDSNGDGVGDLQGMISKLDYLKELGIDVVWLSPMYKSPQDDNGYDISDYQDIHHEFGTMADFDELLQAMHRRGMKLIIDLVVNHTSDEHPWFVESRESRNNPKRDWYIWRDGKNAAEPNNWESIFSGPAWKFDDKTKQYFMHIFSERQPDLNWENADMREAVFRMIRWWLDKGIDGFRVDAISHIKKEPGLSDMPNPEGLAYVPSFAKHMNVEGVHTFIQEMCDKSISKYDVMTIGEANGVKSTDALKWVGTDERKFSMLIQFEYLSLWSTNPNERIQLKELKSVFTRWQKALAHDGWNALFVENHDIPRIVSKWGDPQTYWRESATAIATLYFLLRGTPLIYQGQEIGMTNTVFNGPEDFNDVSAKNYFASKRKQGVSDQDVTAELAVTSRDNARTPMQWSAEKNAGFTNGTPWFQVNPNFTKINVQQQLSDKHSILNFYKKLISLRRENDVLVNGHYDLMLEEHSQIYAYTRSLLSEKILVLCNMTPTEACYDLSTIGVPEALLLNNYSDAQKPSSRPAQKLRPYEAIVLRLTHG